MTRAFLDSNVLIYCFTDKDPRQERALELLERGGVVSVQCLNEFASVTRRKLKMDWGQIGLAFQQIRRLSVQIISLDLDVHRLGLEIAERHRLAVYDGMIVAAALTAGCDTLCSEDMHHGLVVDGRLTVLNPFAL